MSLLNPTAALARAVAGVAAQGFVVVARNTRGDSVYLKPEGCTYALRVSNHARTPKQRKNHPDAITSLVIRASTGPAQVDALVETALRNFAGERRKREGDRGGENDGPAVP
ncbi:MULTISPECIES: hypothetical protein [unclassified Methylobacterium]|uniref:hypothetical protein n=1 Tax=unclassified Methylobacterium TaxID=2615210 RepID=UPI00037E5FFF|nr:MULTISPECIES: hypothetical protein [unclassified Methylobacterium]KQP52236.1 hypothetical protein ASF34_17345 [Methylobacterium sp. Leaf106]